MTIETKIRQAEAHLFETAGLDPDERFLDLPRTGVRLRVLSFGTGRPVLLLHGVTQCAAVWTPLVGALPGGFRLHAVELPGHGMSSPVAYRRGQVRSHTLRLIDDLHEALGPMPVIAHSLGGMFALWYAAARPGTIASLAALGSPAVAVPGSIVRMPLSPMTVPGLGRAMLGSPSPRFLYRWLFAMGTGGAAGEVAPDPLLDVLRLAARRSGNARTAAALMHAINGFRQPRPESVMTAGELAKVSTPTAFVWGTRDPYLAPAAARPWIGKMPAATLHEVTGGHAPWFDDPAGCAGLVTRHLTATGFPPIGGAGGELASGHGRAPGRRDL
jgi:pimeloyl-ACP methyl ester carboxylesterase